LDYQEIKMSINQDCKPSLDGVLARISAASTPPDARTLRAWITRYPQFKAEIIDFATSWVEMDAARSALEVTAEDVNLVVNRTMSRVQALLDAEQPRTIKDLVADIHAVGHDIDSFQRAIGIDRSMLDCLILRLIKPSTIPARLVLALAETLKQPAQVVRNYLLLPPELPAASKALRRPEAKQVDFSAVVEHSSLSDAEKAGWLVETPDSNLRN
jgi:hypothetical protein